VNPRAAGGEVAAVTRVTGTNTIITPRASTKLMRFIADPTPSVSLSGFLAATLTLRNHDAEPPSAELAKPAIKHFGGCLVVSNSEPVVAEGESPSRHLSIVKFPSMEDAKAWYDAPEFAEAPTLTPAAIRGRLLMFVEGA